MQIPKPVKIILLIILLLVSFRFFFPLLFSILAVPLFILTSILRLFELAILAVVIIAGVTFYKSLRKVVRK